MSVQSLSAENDVTNLTFVGPTHAIKLARLGIYTIKDLLYHFPIRYRDTSDVISISQLQADRVGTVCGEVLSIKNSYTRYGKVITKAQISDSSGKARIIWFNQAFLTRAIKPGNLFLFELKLPEKTGAKDFYCSGYELLSETNEQTHLGRITPIYDQTEGISSKWLRARIKSLRSRIRVLIKDTLETSILDKYNLLSLEDALEKIHFPDNFEEVEAARTRLGFDEMLNIALKIEQNIQSRKSNSSPAILTDQKRLNRFILKLNYELTDDQVKALSEITTDLAKEVPMHRLINGEVGSGKTILAALASLTCAWQGYSTVTMAPTTVLAHQHFQSLTELLESEAIKVQLLTRGMMLEPSQKPQLIIGTHALLFEQEMPQNIGLVIVDEEHRFGVGQREQLHQGKSETKGLSFKKSPHYLTLTATPIPRTLTKILYGDMDVSFINQLPKNRIPVKTFVVTHEKVEGCYSWVKEQIIKSNRNQQAYIIYPLIEESEKSDLKAAKKGYEDLSKGLFKELKVGLLHGRLKDEEKKRLLTQFRQKKINILVATTVIEVGIDMPDASIIIVENAERFGLAQLHQLRGRVGRGTFESYCYVIPGSNVESGSNSTNRLKYFAQHNSGFDIAQFDLESRGPGEIYSTKQAGLPDLKIADITDIKLLQKAREFARELLAPQATP